MKNNIELYDTDKYGPASTQLQVAGKNISDTWYRESKTDIWDEFKMHANQNYRLVSCHETDEEDAECGLCAHDIYYGCEIVASTPLVTNHPELDTRITWPTHMTIGTTCVKMLKLDSYAMRFVASCFKPRYSPAIELDSNGLVDIGASIILDPLNWNSYYEFLVLPHSVFALLPIDVMVEAGLQFHVLRNKFDPKRKLEKTIYDSFHKSRKGKWKSAYTVSPSPTFYADGMLNYDLATVITRDDAKRLNEIISKTKEQNEKAK